MSIRIWYWQLEASGTHHRPMNMNMNPYAKRNTKTFPWPVSQWSQGKEWTEFQCPIRSMIVTSFYQALLNTLLNSLGLSTVPGLICHSLGSPPVASLIDTWGSPRMIVRSLIGAISPGFLSQLELPPKISLEKKTKNLTTMVEFLNSFIVEGTEKFYCRHRGEQVYYKQF